MRFIFFYFLLFVACQQETIQEVPADRGNYFFDLKAFFNKEIERLDKVSSFQKLVQINDKKEEKTFDELDLKSELAVFINSDINRPAWSDKYSVDSVFNEQKQLIKITYLARDKKLKTNSLTVYFENSEVNSIHILKKAENLATDSFQELKYWAGKGYSVLNNQTLIMSDPQTIKVEVNFLSD